LVLRRKDPAHTGKLLGTIRDSRGRTLPGAVVTVQRVAPGAGNGDTTITITTDVNGAYFLPDLAYGALRDARRGEEP